MQSAALLALALAAGCAPAVATMALPNPARAASAIEATQTYEVPPYRDDHRYELTLARWTPDSLGFRIHLVNADRCGLPSSYSFELVDDRARRYAFQRAAPPQDTSRRGHLGAMLHDATLDGVFNVPVDAATRYVIVEVRPIADRGCTALDFRWDFRG